MIVLSDMIGKFSLDSQYKSIGILQMLTELLFGIRKAKELFS